MHIHMGIAHILVTFFTSVVMVGVFWRITACWLVAQDSAVLNNIGKAMAFAY